MKLTKFAHACILVEDDEHVALFDPGEFSWSSGLVKLDNWPKLDYVMITHEHFDHFSEDFVKAILHQFPNVQFFGTEPTVTKLKELGAKNTSASSTKDIEILPLTHASMSPLAPDPNVPNIAIHYRNKITHPGDSHALVASKDVLFVPFAGPWGATIDGVRMAVKLKPKVVVPIHDWMWNDSWRDNMYARMEGFFQQQNIRFIRTVDGEPFEI